MFEESLVYQLPYWDKSQFYRFRRKDQDCDQYIQIGSEKIYSFPQFAAEVFHRFYSADESSYTTEEEGTRLPEAKIKPEAQWAKILHDELTDSQDFKELQEQVEGKAFLAGMAANVFIQSLAKRLATPPQPLQNPNELRRQVVPLVRRKRPEDKADIQRLTAEGMEAVRFIQKWTQNMFNADSNQDAQKAGEEILRDEAMEMTLEDLIGSGEGEGDESEQGQQGQPGQGQGSGAMSQEDMPQDQQEMLAGAISLALAEASESVQETQEMFAALGYGLEEGQDQFIGNSDELQSLAGKIQRSGKLKGILKKAGRLKKIAAKKSESKSINVPREIKSLEQGDDLSRIVPAELLQFHMPKTRKLFKKDLVEHSLTQYKMGGKEKLGRGPLVVLDDVSGSMEGTPNMEAKALCLAMLGLAQKQKRHFRLIQFDTCVKRIDDFAPKEKDLGRMLSAMGYFSNGGTNFMRPLDSAVECIEKYSQYKGADILLITDGEAPLYDSWLEEFNKKQKHLCFEVYALAIGSADTGVLKRFIKPENIITIPSLGSLSADEQVSELFAI
jgi:uncharacterized protein with von Willebrand factor type A (vWA) domain